MKHNILSSFVLISLFHSTVWAQTNHQQGLSTHAIQLPSGPGTVQGLGESFQPALNTGTSHLNFSFTLPKGLGGLSPQLELEYNSGFATGIVGAGRQLSIPYIQRKTYHGVPHYDLTEISGIKLPKDTFITQDGTELIEVQPDVYQAKLGEHFIRYQKTRSGWLATAPNGVRYTFSSTPDASIQAHTMRGIHLGTFRWLLTKIEDRQGHEIEYTYQKLDDTAQQYLHQITYNQRGSLAHHIRFDYELRPDFINNYTGGFELTTQYRLKEVSIDAGSQVIRRYQMLYAPVELWQTQSLLEKISIKNGAETQTLITHQYSYTDAHTTPQTARIPSLQTAGAHGADSGYIDLNADGLPDLLSTHHGRHSYWLNQGVNADGEVEFTQRQQMRQVMHQNLSSKQVHYADVDADGHSELIVEGQNKTVLYRIDEDLNWQRDQDLGHTNLKLYSDHTRLIDLNHDQRIDVLQNTNGNRLSVLLNTEDGWSEHNIPVPIPRGINLADQRIKTADMNGDGIVDLVIASQRTLRFYPGQGLQGFDTGINFQGMPTNLYQEDKIHLADMNHDGLADLVYLHGSTVSVWPNLGARDGVYQLGQQINVQSPSRSRKDKISLVDINGNGSTDIVWFNQGRGRNSTTFVDFYPNETPRMLKTIDNGLGKKTTLFYGSIAAEMVRDQKQGRQWHKTSPLAMQVLKRIEVDNGLDKKPQITTYDYHDSYYHAPERRFNGFAATEQLQQGSAHTPSLLTAYTYHLGDQDEVLKGKVKSIATKNQAGKIFWEIFNQWEAKELFSDPLTEDTVTFAALKERKKIHHELGQGQSVTTHTSYMYDDFGHLIEQHDWGREDKKFSGDEKITRWTYSSALAHLQQNHLLDFLLEKSIYDGDDELLQKEQIIYDSPQFSLGSWGDITEGQLSARVTWSNPHDQQSMIFLERKHYNQDGMVSHVYDPLWGKEPGHYRTYNYDADFGLYPEQETLYTGTTTLTAQATYDTHLGVMTEMLDFNGQKTSMQYDDFGRLIAIAKPGDNLSSPTLRYDYALHQPTSEGIVNWVDTYQKLTESTSKQSRVFFDGAGQMRMKRVQSRAGVNVWNQKTFDQRGRPIQSFEPYAATGFAYEVDATQNATTFYYDALGRQVKAMQPDTLADNQQAFSITRYEPLKTWHEDENQASGQRSGAGKWLVFDGLGRHRQTVDYVSIDAQGEQGSLHHWITQYTYNPQGFMTGFTDAQQHHRSMKYDALGHVTYVHDPDRGETWNQYNDAGLLTQQRNSLGDILLFEYDGVNRILHQQSARRDANHATKITAQKTLARYVYDRSVFKDQTQLKGRLSSLTDTAGQAFYSYDARGQLIDQQRKIQGHGIKTNFYRTRRAYNAASQLSQLTYHDGTQVNYDYDSAGMLQSISGVVNDITYTPQGQIATRTLANDVVTHYVFDARQRLSHMYSEHDHQRIQDLTYDFDASHHITAQHDQRDASFISTLAKKLSIADTSLSQSATYAYDDLYRLTQVHQGVDQYHFRYDPTGNRLTKKVNDQVTSYRYGEKAGPHAMTFAEHPIHYDALGRRTDDHHAQYTWDPLHRLTQVQSKGSKLYFGYDTAGKRRYKITQSFGDSKKSVLYIDDVTEIRDGKMIKYVLLGSKKIASSTQKSSTFKPTTYYLTDHLGSSSMLLNPKSDITGIRIYAPYGETQQQAGETTPYGYTGKEQDALSHLGYFEQRYLDHGHGQFLSPDPIFMLDGRMNDPQHFAPYAYARNNPMVYVDENGEYAHIVTGAAVGAISGGFSNFITNYSENISLYNAGKLIIEGATGGAVSGTMLAANPISIISMGASLVAGNLTSQAIHTAFKGQDVLNMDNYDWIQTAFQVALSPITFKASSVITKYIPHDFSKNLYKYDKNMQGQHVKPYLRYEIIVATYLAAQENKAVANASRGMNSVINFIEKPFFRQSFSDGIKDMVGSVLNQSAQEAVDR